jgi:phosphoribosylanthranilate isomerase
MKAIRVKDAAAVRGAGAFQTDFHLLDAYVPDVRGGTGATFEWELLRHHAGGVPVVLSGGLTAENVGAAIAATRPFAVDSASGTEATPGRKDPAKLEAFARAVTFADELAADPDEVRA